jgi:hypothetical protein
MDMGSNRSGVRRVLKQKRTKRDQARLLRKLEAAAQKPPPAPQQEKGQS